MVTSKLRPKEKTPNPAGLQSVYVCVQETDEIKGREWGEHLKEALRLNKPQRSQRTKLETMWLNERGMVLRQV